MWLEISDSECQLLRSALDRQIERQSRDTADLRILRDRLEQPEQHPQITVGAYGGLVQWILGNPFPIRICDYDGEENDLADIDERGQRCSMWIEPPSA